MQPSRVVALEGELDLASRETLTAVFQELSEANTPVVVDLHNVTFMDAGVLGQLIYCSNTSRAAGIPFILHRPSRAVRRLMHMTSTVDTFAWEASDDVRYA
jgi:anti-anti-sigma factor